MGAFVVNFHVRTSSPKQVAEVLKSMNLEAAWIASSSGPWVSFWEGEASRQDPMRVQQLAQPVSRQLEAPVIAFMNHDSDFICYWLYDNGQLLDEYNSCPGYFDGDVSQEEVLAADCPTLAKYCRPGTSVDELETVLKVWTQSDAAQGITSGYVFAEERLSALAALLGIDKMRVNVDYGDIGPEVPPGEIGAEWIGTGQPGDVPGIFGERVFESNASGEVPVAIPPAPLHEAARRGDLAAIERLVAEGADINETNQVHLFTPLALAAHESTPEVVRRLVELGADIHAKGDDRISASPLNMAVAGGKADNVRTLIELGADVHEFNPNVGSMLHVAALKGSVEIAQLLLDAGVDPLRPSAKGQTPLEVIRTHRVRIEEGMKMVPQNAMPPQIRQHIDAMIAIEKLLSERDS